MSSYDSIDVAVQYIDDSDPFNVLGSIKHAAPSPPIQYSFVSSIPLCDQVAGLKKALNAPHKIDDATLVYYRSVDKESRYLDLESDLSELAQDYNLSFDKDAVIFMRHKLSVRVHTIVGKIVVSSFLLSLFALSSSFTFLSSSHRDSTQCR
jgi:hypothetical protein